MSEIEDLLRASFVQRSTEIVATPDLLDRVRRAGPADQPWQRRPWFHTLAAAAAVVVVVASAWLGIRAGFPAPARPGHTPTRHDQPAVPRPTPSRPVTSPPVAPTSVPTSVPTPVAVPTTGSPPSATVPERPSVTRGSSLPAARTGPAASPATTGATATPAVT